MTELTAVLELSVSPDLGYGVEPPLCAHLPVPSPDEDEEDEAVRRNPGGGNIDPDDDESGEDDDEDEDDDEEGLILNRGAAAEAFALSTPARGLAIRATIALAAICGCPDGCPPRASFPGNRLIGS